VTCAKAAKPIDLPFGLWTPVGLRKHKLNRIPQVAPMCPHGRAHWRHLANMIEPSVCGCDAVLCHITLTTSVPAPLHNLIWSGWGCWHAAVLTRSTATVHCC